MRMDDGTSERRTGEVEDGGRRKRQGRKRNGEAESSVVHREEEKNCSSNQH